MSGTSNHNTVSNNTLSDTWGAAIKVGQGTSQNLITQNSIQNSNTVFATSGAIELDNTGTTPSRIITFKMCLGSASPTFKRAAVRAPILLHTTPW